MNLVASFSASLLNLALQCTVVDMANRTDSMSTINITWSVTRDLANISFIFILLYARISTILDLQGANWKKTVIGVVVSAVLVNFSMFFTKVVIDASNIVTLGIYQSIAPGAGSAPGCSWAAATASTGLANIFTDPMKLQTIFSPGSYYIDSSQIFIIGLFGSALLAIAAFVFFAASILFISRFVTLILVLILSPIGIVGSVIPGLSSIKNKWLETLTGQAIFAPLFMLMAWISATIINDPNFFAVPSGTAQTFSTLILQRDSNDVSLIFNFIIVIAIFIATLVISKSYANKGYTYGQKLVGGVLGGSMGAAAWTGRKTFGKVGPVPGEIPPGGTTQPFLAFLTTGPMVYSSQRLGQKQMEVTVIDADNTVSPARITCSNLVVF
jgi:hypothetical protein